MEKFTMLALSPDLQVANVPYNVQRIQDAMQRTRKEERIVVFPRLCLCGATCGDLFLQPSLADACLVGLKGLLDCSRDKPSVFFVGMPLKIEGALYDVAVALSGGKILGVVVNDCLSLEDKRRFSVLEGEGTLSLLGDDVPYGADFTFDVFGKKITCLIGAEEEKILSRANRLKQKGVVGFVHLSSATEGVGQALVRQRLAQKVSAGGCFYLCSNPAWGESTSWDVYSAHNLYAKNGVLCAQTVPFGDGVLRVDENTTKEITVSSHVDKLTPFPFLPQENVDETCALIFEIQARSLAKRIMHAHARTAVIGVSGGLDSTLALLVIDKAFDILKKDKKELIAVTMPGFGTTGKTLKNALGLIDAIGATTKTIDIKKSVLQHFEDIGHDPEKLDTTYENAQARMRTLILMDIANATGGIVVGTGDLSESALGWCTYNGDHMSMYSVNATLPKTLIRKVVERVAQTYDETMKGTLLSVLGTEISPELLPPSKDGKIAQKTEELVGPYELQDFFLYYSIGQNKTPTETYALAMQAFGEKFDGDTIKKWLKNFYKRFFTQQFKRSCAPDGANIGVISFSPLRWQMPSDACADVWIMEADNL